MQLYLDRPESDKFSQSILQALESDNSDMFVVPVSRASLGLIAVLRSWKERGRGRLVAVSGAVCHDVVAAILEAGCDPWFCDVDYKGLVTKNEWERARRSGATVAIVVHLYGNVADYDCVESVFSSPNCLVIDDAAQALGAKYDDNYVGTMGNVGLISFGKTKHITVGAAAILLKGKQLYKEVRGQLELMKFASEKKIRIVDQIFRVGFEEARKKLRKNSDNTGFSELLSEYQEPLYPPFFTKLIDKVDNVLLTLPIVTHLRQEKAKKWEELLQPSGFVFLVEGKNSAPWRSVCRLPGINWKEQYSLGEAMRSKGVDVSHWYLPANWLLNETATLCLTGVETLAREVFQFWIDENTSIEKIKNDAIIVKSIIKEFRKAT